MDEESKSEVNGSRLVVSAGADAIAAALGLTGDPVLAIGSAAVAAVLPDLMMLRSEKAVNAIVAVVQWCARDGDVAGLAERLKRHPEALVLATDAATAVARTSYEVKVEAIRRAMADGVLYEEGTVFDVDASIVRIIAALERPHFTVLMHAGADDAPTVDDLSQAYPEYEVIMPSLLAALIREGLVHSLWTPGDGTYVVGDARPLTELGVRVRNYITGDAPAQ